MVPGNSKVVYLPEIDYQKIPNFWKKVRQHDFDKTFDPKLITSLSELLKDYEINQPLLEKREKQFKKIQKHLAQVLVQIFGTKVANKEYLIEIYPSSFRTMCSFGQKSTSDRKTVLYVEYRIDMPIDYLIEGIVSNFVKSQYANGIWQGSEHLSYESIVDFLMLKTSISDFISNEYVPTIQIINSKENLVDLKKASDKFISRLGFSNKPSLNYISGKLFIEGREAQYPLTDSEECLLAGLYNNLGKVVAFEELGELLWGDDTASKYSQWAITKAIQQLRDKLKANGINKEVILTKRGKGYMLAS
ncbi:MAG: hypothetical protein Fur003_1040 [Candidatus Dojkabacteria bacterium]